MNVVASNTQDTSPYQPQNRGGCVPCPWSLISGQSARHRCCSLCYLRHLGYHVTCCDCGRRSRARARSCLCVWVFVRACLFVLWQALARASAFVSVCLSVRTCLPVRAFFVSKTVSVHGLCFCQRSASVSVCLSVSLSVCLSVCVSVCLSVCASVCLSICLSVSVSLSLSPPLSVCLSVCLSVSVSVSVSLSLSLSLSLTLPLPPLSGLSLSFFLSQTYSRSVSTKSQRVGRNVPAEVMAIARPTSMKHCLTMTWCHTRVGIKSCFCCCCCFVFCFALISIYLDRLYSEVTNFCWCLFL